MKFVFGIGIKAADTSHQCKSTETKSKETMAVLLPLPKALETLLERFIHAIIPL